VLIQDYPRKSRNDINEEIFVTEMAKYISGKPSSFTNLDDKTLHEVLYTVRRTLDSILMG